jgi:hypothetical protein
MVDEDGDLIGDDLSTVDALFTTVFWMLATHQDTQDWQTWARRAAQQIVYLEQHPSDDDEDVPDDEQEAMERASEALGSELVEIFGRDGDNPMRSSADLLRARERWHSRRRTNFFL